jgi:hypothetical protein
MKGAAPPPDPKLNEVHHRISSESIAVVVEVGRPGVGTSMRDVDAICRALAASGVSFDPGSSVTGLMVDVAAGTLQPDVLDERVMHAMIHYSCSRDQLLASIEALKEVANRVHTVFSVGFSTPVDNRNDRLAGAIADEAGLPLKPHAKTNVGLGPRRKEVAP